MRAIHLVAVLMFLGAGLLVVPMPSSAATSRGSIQIHSRVCPAGAIQLYRDCHDSPGPSGAMFTVDSRVPKPIADNGNVSFGRVTAADHLISITSGYSARSYRRLAAYCSNSTTGIYPQIATITFQPEPQFWVRVGSGSRLTCDVYFVR